MKLKDYIIKSLKSIVKFKMFNVNYVIEKLNDKPVIYQELNSIRKQSYNTIDDMFNNYLIYNEPLIDNENLIQKIYK